MATLFVPAEGGVPLTDAAVVGAALRGEALGAYPGAQEAVRCLLAARMTGARLNVGHGGGGAEAAGRLAAALPSLRLAALDAEYAGLGPAGAAALADALPAAPTLRALSVAACGLGDAGAAALASRLPAAPRLHELRLDLNGVTWRGAAALASAAPHLRALHLRGNRLGDRGARELAAALPAGAPSLVELGVERCGLGPAGAEALVEGLAACRRLRKLRLGHNDVGPDAAAAAVRGLRLLDLLELERTGLGDAGAEAVAAALSPRGAGGRAGLNLRLGYNGVAQKGAGALAAAIGVAGRRLRVLDVRGNKLRQEGAAALCDAAGRPGVALEHLVLRSNGVGGGEGAVTTVLLSGAGALRNLNLEYNDLGPADAWPVAAQLAPSRLDRLMLGGNLLKDDGVRALAVSLLGAPALRVLSLWGAGMGVTGAEVLAEALRSDGCRLESLSLANNPDVGDAGAGAVAEALLFGGGGHALQVLSLARCNAGPRTASALARAVAGDRDPLGNASSLRVLGIRGNRRITAEELDVPVLAPALERSSPRLQRLLVDDEIVHVSQRLHAARRARLRGLLTTVARLGLCRKRAAEVVFHPARRTFTVDDD